MTTKEFLDMIARLLTSKEPYIGRHRKRNIHVLVVNSKTMALVPNPDTDREAFVARASTFDPYVQLHLFVAHAKRYGETRLTDADRRSALDYGLACGMIQEPEEGIIVQGPDDDDLDKIIQRATILPY